MSIKWVVGNNPGAIGDKIPGGHEYTGKPIYIARAKYEGGVHPGKYTDTVGRGAIGYNHKEVELSDYQIATGNESQFKWVKQSGIFSKNNLSGAKPVQAGYELYSDGYDVTLLYIARAQVTVDGTDRGVHCGKVWEGIASKVPYGGKEYDINDYEVLVHA